MNNCKRSNNLIRNTIRLILMKQLFTDMEKCGSYGILRKLQCFHKDRNKENNFHVGIII